ncbi:T9SS type A sorting domain-containing protein [Ascidiimonas sp. W6]|uniref:T9SS type A sorting domain-containing protein n=1 Tax=Ascidiimonas meishanensis TaxID=3128903 RepID=UPI0030ECF40A
MKINLLLRQSLCTVLFVFLMQSGSSQNLLNTNTWTVGSGSVSGFTQNGSTSENSREWGKNHIGENVILWKASPEADVGADGGWNSSYHAVDHTKTYRFSVWIKKTNSTNGTTYLGCNSTNNILTLSGAVNNNPYFWYGDLPKFNRWYLIVGFVHKSSYTSSTNLGRIYDGVTGQSVATITDFKFKNTATSARHRSYLYYDTNTSDRQYFWAPRMEQINGNEPSINELLSIHSNMTLIFTLDSAGNQKQRLYCPDSACRVATTTSKEDTTDSDEEYDEALLEDKELTEAAIDFYPNPTKGMVNISLSGNPNTEMVNNLYVYNAQGARVKSIRLTEAQRSLSLDLRTLPAGVYIVHIHLSDEQSITKKIIKN